MSRIHFVSVLFALAFVGLPTFAQSPEQQIAALKAENNQLSEQLFKTRNDLLSVQTEVVKTRIELKNLTSEYDLAKELADVDSDYIDIVNNLQSQKEKLDTLLSLKSRLLSQRETELNEISAQIEQNEKQLEVFAVRYGIDINAVPKPTPTPSPAPSPSETANNKRTSPPTKPEKQERQQKPIYTEPIVPDEPKVVNAPTRGRFSTTKYEFGELFPTFIEITSADNQFNLGVSETEITVEQFKLFQKEARYRTESQRSGGCNIFDYETKNDRTANSDSPGYRQSDSHPIVCISMFDAIKYTKWLSKKLNRTVRLPTRSEWFTFSTPHEMAALEKENGMARNCLHANIRDHAFAGRFGDDSSEICNDSSVNAEPVKLKLPNSLGLYNLYGNVREWTMSCRDDSIKNLWVCPSVHIAGGSAYYKLDPRKETRGGPDGVGNDVGFRVVYEL